MCDIYPFKIMNNQNIPEIYPLDKQYDSTIHPDIRIRLVPKNLVAKFTGTFNQWKIVECFSAVIIVESSFIFSEGSNVSSEGFINLGRLKWLEWTFSNSPNAT